MNEFSLPLKELLQFIDEPHRKRCQSFLANNWETLKTAFGSRAAHHAWPGGYLDHITETMRLAYIMYLKVSPFRELPFSLSDALVVLFLHDIEKPWKYDFDSEGKPVVTAQCATKEGQRKFRQEMIGSYGFNLSPDQLNALNYAEDEHDYVPGDRKQTPLAAFCHCCDNMSARIFHEFPEPELRGKQVV